MAATACVALPTIGRRCQAAEIEALLNRTRRLPDGDYFVKRSIYIPDGSRIGSVTIESANNQVPIAYVSGGKSGIRIRHLHLKYTH
jgi:hypothetical protein